VSHLADICHLHLKLQSHCLGGYITRIVVGDDGLDVGEEIAVKFEMAHPDYDFDLDKNDIGLIFLQKPVTIDLPLLRPNDDSSLPVPGSTVYVMGWGDTDPTKSIQNMPDELMIVELEVISNADCEKAESGTDSYDGYISDDMLCTEYEGQDACQGDSGESITLFDVRSTSTSRKLSNHAHCSI
jgi:secreted trypsin-like serine protease